MIAPAVVMRPISSASGSVNHGRRRGRRRCRREAPASARELGDPPAGRDAADAVAARLGEPERAVGAGDDAVGNERRSGGDRSHPRRLVESAVPPLWKRSVTHRAPSPPIAAPAGRCRPRRGDLALGGDAPQPPEAAVRRVHRVILGPVAMRSLWLQQTRAQRVLLDVGRGERRSRGSRPRASPHGAVRAGGGLRAELHAGASWGRGEGRKPRQDGGWPGGPATRAISRTGVRFSVLLSGARRAARAAACSARRARRARR